MDNIISTIEYSLKEHRMKHVLLAVTGLTPAIITETLWALNQEYQNNKATEQPIEAIKIIATSKSEKKIQELYTDNDNDKSKLHELHSDWGMPEIAFTRGDVTLFEDNITALEDLEHQSIDQLIPDQTLKFIANYALESEEVRFQITVAETDTNTNKFLEDKLSYYAQNCSSFKQLKVKGKGVNREVVIELFTYKLHVSVGGGRKAMSFFLGYAMSLLGREFDEMSQVIVDEFAEVPKFYFPTKQKEMLCYKYPNEDTQFDASTIKVLLPRIPFVRLSNSLNIRPSIETLRYSELIDYVNVSLDTRSVKVVLEININKQDEDEPCSVSSSLQINHKVIESLNEVELAYLMTVFEKENEDFIEFGQSLNLKSRYFSFLSHYIYLFTGEKKQISSIEEVFSLLEKQSKLITYRDLMIKLMGVKHYGDGLPEDEVKAKADKGQYILNTSDNEFIPKLKKIVEYRKKNINNPKKVVNEHESFEEKYKGSLGLFDIFCGEFLTPFAVEKNSLNTKLENQFNKSLVKMLQTQVVRKITDKDYSKIKHNVFKTLLSPSNVTVNVKVK